MKFKEVCMLNIRKYLSYNRFSIRIYFPLNPNLIDLIISRFLELKLKRAEELITVEND